VLLVVPDQRAEQPTKPCFDQKHANKIRISSTYYTVPVHKQLYIWIYTTRKKKLSRYIYTERQREKERGFVDVVDVYMGWC
jgi:hypothetical protein